MRSLSISLHSCIHRSLVAHVQLLPPAQAMHIGIILSRRRVYSIQMSFLARRRVFAIDRALQLVDVVLCVGRHTDEFAQRSYRE